MRFNNIGVVGAIAIGIGAIAWLTNPGEQKYQQYADATIKTELKNKVCVQVTEDTGVWLEGQCHLLINAASPYLVDIINQQTERQNFFLFSIYQADLSLPSPLPDYQLKTIGILGNFFLYRTEKL